MADNKMDIDTDQKNDANNMLDENVKSHKMDLQSRSMAAVGVETMKKLSQLSVLIIGAKGVGIETAKNLILTGVYSVTLYDNDIVKIADLGSNFYLKKQDVGKQPKSDVCTKLLAELNPYCKVNNYTNDLNANFIQSFGAVIVTKTIAQKELLRINQLCRTNTSSDGQPHPSLFILAVTHGITGHIFSDFGPNHIVTDPDGEPSKTFVIDHFDHENNLVSIDKDPTKKHGFYDGDLITIEGIEAEADQKLDDNTVSIEALNKLESIKIKRKYIQFEEEKDGKTQKRTKQIFNKFILDLSDTPLANKKLSNWKTGGLINQIKPKKELKFRSLSECLRIPINVNDFQQKFYGPMHPHQDSWAKGVGKTIHLLYCSALQFNDENGYFPRLHNEKDSTQFTQIFTKINKENAESKIQDICFVQEPFDRKRINAYSWYFECELTGYCSFLGGVAAQEVVKKFGKYTPIEQWLHCDHINLVGREIPSDATPENCRYDHQISIFGKLFQKKLSNQKIFLVGTGALGCEYLKGLALMGVSTGKYGKVWCTDMDHIEISNLSRQFLFRAKHVGKPKSVIAAAAAQEINNFFNVEALKMKVWPETENYFTDIFWDNLDFCWNALDNVLARKYTDNKCLLHSKVLLESGTQGTKCNSEIIIPYKTKSYNDGVEQETEGIAMCTLQNFPYLPIHCIEWARSKFLGLFENEAKIYNTFIGDDRKWKQQLQTAQDAEKYEMLKTIEKFINIEKNEKYNECIRLAFEEYVKQHIHKIKDLTFTFPENDVVKDKTGEIVGKFWSGHKKFPSIPIFDLNDEDILNYLYATSSLYAYTFGIKRKDIANDIQDFKKIAEKCNLTVAEWEKPVGLNIKVDENESNEENKNEEKLDEQKEKEIQELIEKFDHIDKSKLISEMKEIEFEKDDDNNFHIDYMTYAANARARNYKIKQLSRYQCKIIAGKIIAALASTTSMICGLVELEFYKLNLGLKYVQQNAFYNANINLAVSTFQFFEPEATIKHEDYEIKDDVDYEKIEKHIAFPSQWTSWDSLVVDEGNLSINEFVNIFSKLFNGIMVDQLQKPNTKIGKFIYNANDRRSTSQQDRQLSNKNLSDKIRSIFLKQKQDILKYNEKIKQKQEEKIIDRYIDLYGKLVSEERNYIILTGTFLMPNKNEQIFVDLPRITYLFK